MELDRHQVSRLGACFHTVSHSQAIREQACIRKGKAIDRRRLEGRDSVWKPPPSAKYKGKIRASKNLRQVLQKLSGPVQKRQIVKVVNHHKDVCSAGGGPYR